MNAVLTEDGKIALPTELRENAQLKPGDKLDVGYVNGLVVLRKHRPLALAEARALILSGRELPEMTEADAEEVAAVIKSVRRRRRA